MSEEDSAKNNTAASSASNSDSSETEDVTDRIDALEKQANHICREINKELHEMDKDNSTATDAAAGNPGGSNEKQKNKKRKRTQKKKSKRSDKAGQVDKISKIESTLSVLADQLAQLKERNRKKREESNQGNRKSPDDTSGSSSSEDSDEEQNLLPFSLPHTHEAVNVNLTGGTKVGSSIPKKVMKKIWTHQYVDFTDLLPAESTENYKVQFQPNSPMPFNVVKNRRAPITRNEWNTAWDEYLTIYIQKHPTHITEMMTYGKTIRSMITSNYDWRMYDEAFRRRRATSNDQDKASSWTELKIDLYLQAMNKPSQTMHAPKYFDTNTNRYTATNRYNSIPVGECFRYHSRALYCKGQCNFEHTCYKKIGETRCNGKHPSYLCKRATTAYFKGHSFKRQGGRENSTFKKNRSAPNPDKA